MDWRKYFIEEWNICCGAVSIRHRGNAEFIGSAAYVAPGLFITAKHVIEEPINREGLLREITENKKYGQLDANLNIKNHKIEIVHLLKPEHKIAQRWVVKHINFSHDLDIAILTCQTTSGPLNPIINTLPRTIINIHPTQKSTDVECIGFHGGENEESKQRNDGNQNHTLTLDAVPGNLVSFNPNTTSVAGAAVYEIDNKIEHMMSGGPVINHDGAILAVNSSGIYFDEENRTIATPILRSMFMEFDYYKNGAKVKTSLKKLAEEGEITVLGHNHLTQTDEHILFKPTKQCGYCHKETTTK